MQVNGEPKLTCKTALREYGSTVEVAPLANFPVVRDLVVELEGFLDKLQVVRPWIIEAKDAARVEGTHRQTPDELAAFKKFSMCINCMLCYAACPVVANEPDFLGPAAIALGHRYNQDSRDHGAAERNEVFREDGGVFACSFANECTRGVPEARRPGLCDPGGEAAERDRLGDGLRRDRGSRAMSARARVDAMRPKPPGRARAPPRRACPTATRRAAATSPYIAFGSCGFLLLRGRVRHPARRLGARRRTIRPPGRRT